MRGSLGGEATWSTIRLRLEARRYAGEMRFDRIRGITFDAGGTLIAPNPGVGEIYADVAAQHGVRADPEVLDARFRVAFKHLRASGDWPVSDHSEQEFWQVLARGVFLDVATDDEFAEMFPTLWSTFANARRWRLLDGARQTLEVLKRRGFRLAVLSNFDSRLHSILDGLGITPLLDDVFISAEAGVAKPRLGIFKHASQMLGLRAGQLLHVGDSAEADAAGATGAGWSAVLIGGEYPGAATISRLDEIPGLID
jgi:putative hydrolase of the HAD superfamily